MVLKHIFDILTTMKTNLTIQDVLKALNESDAIDAVSAEWNESMATLPDTTLHFLEPDAIIHNREVTSLPYKYDPILLTTADKINNNASLRLLAWHFYHRLITTKEEKINSTDWPELKTALGDSSGTFYLLIALAMAPHIIALHKKMNIDQNITKNTLKVASSVCMNYSKGHNGHPGIFRKQIYWLQHHIRGKIFRIGRLEYYITHLKQYDGGCHVYRNKQQNHIEVLARNGANFDKDGRTCSNESDPNINWTAKLTITPDSVTGSPINPDGFAQHTRVTLPTSEWALAMDPQSIVLSLHIPAGGRLAPQDFIESMSQAFDFFDHHFSEQPAVAILCRSWIYGEMLERILPATSNLVMNIRETYRWATQSAVCNYSLWFIFCQADGGFDLASAKATSSLEESILNYLNSGGIWRDGSMFFMRNDLKEFGSQLYRKIYN